MSTLVVTAHLATITVRYAVGRWYNVPTITVVAFNSTAIGLNFLVRSILNYAVPNFLQLSLYIKLPVVLASKVIICLTAVYATSTLTKPMPLKTAALTSVAAIVTVTSVLIIFNLEEKK